MEKQRTSRSIRKRLSDRNLFFFLACLATWSILIAMPAKAEDVTLSEDDAKSLQAIVNKDKYLQNLGKQDGELKGLGFLNKIAGMTISGPVKIAVKWNQQLIEGWRSANKKLVDIGKAVICNDIQLASVNSDGNSQFFDEMYEARGCE